MDFITREQIIYNMLSNTHVFKGQFSVIFLRGREVNSRELHILEILAATHTLQLKLKAAVHVQTVTSLLRINDKIQWVGCLYD